jgi:hypothetical protein
MTDIYMTKSKTNVLQLRFNYTNLERLSPLAKQIERMQNDCKIHKHGIFRHRNYAGLGSELHSYSMGLCTALELKNVRLKSIGSWIYRDEQQCLKIGDIDSPMSCYFPQSEPICPTDNDNTTKVNITKENGSIDAKSCPTVKRKTVGGTSAIRAATTEYLFTRISNVVQEEGERQLYTLFGTNTKTNRHVPKNLITVHIRWGDKGVEMKLVTITSYIDAIQQILDQRNLKKRPEQQQQNHMVYIETQSGLNSTKDDNDSDDKVHILLCTEDPEALDHFMKVKPVHWNVYIDQYYVEMLPYREQVGNVLNANVMTAESLNGRSGLIALGSLLVAMEANDYVLTTGSNWSRLMNEIRKNIINPRCDNCTTMIDLKHGEYR